MHERKLAELRQRLLDFGLRPGSEQYDVCFVAMEYLGFPYLRTEELSQNSIDCSTLTSQSYWEGAIIGIPFTAEGQRLASSGKSINSINEAEPGDVFVRYQSFEVSPDKRYNHVGLFLGWDQRGDGWIIEARGGQGVILSPAKDFPPLGGIKRFIFASKTLGPLSRQLEARNVAQRVPKLGRLGTRQYLVDGETRRAHRGVDIYADSGTVVMSPVGGVAALYYCQIENARGVEITSWLYASQIKVRLLHVDSELKVGEAVLQGQAIGTITPPKASKVHYVNGISRDMSHLHFEVECTDDDILGIRSFTKIDLNYYFNGLYFAKAGILTVPIKATPLDWSC